LQKGDLLPLAGSFANPPRLVLPDGLVTTDSVTPLRLLPGRDWSAFSPAAQAALREDRFTLTPQADRMGYRLQGPTLALAAPRECLSEAVAFGTVQVPPDGQPIVLMADHQTTGGYPCIAQVAQVDLPRLAQCVPGDHLSFTFLDLAEAQRLDIARERLLTALEGSARSA
jgi:allophanate hydrolase subunit 2